LAKVKKTFRIEEDAYDELVELSAGWGVAQGAAIERAIRLARQMPDTLPDTLPDTCQTGASTHGGGDSAAVAALIEQLAKKDEQIAKLMETVADSTKAVQGAQALHHETAQTLALESTEQKQSRWQRLKRAWMGI
jgi:hypothetical protein